MRKMFVAAVAVVLLAACESLGWGEGEIRLSFVDGEYVSTKASYSLPDTSDFILEVRNPEGKQIYKGIYGNSPEGLLVSSGTYNISVRSSDAEMPAFESPVFGDEQVVKVSPGSKVNVRLVCYQVNCGVRLKIDPSFLDGCPDGLLYLKSEEGRLHYAYRENRIAYFNPGTISLVLNDKGREESLLARKLSSQQVLTLNVSASTAYSGSGSSLSVKLDTTRTWNSEDYVIGGSEGKGGSIDNALSVNTARDNIGASAVWVLGYIVGGDLTSGAEGISYEMPFTSKTNLALGPRSSVSTKQSCMSVALPSGKIRDALNLNENAGLLGRQIYVKGDIVAAYYGIPGIKNVTEFQLK